MLFLLYVSDYKLKKKCENEFASTCNTATWRITVFLGTQNAFGLYLEPF